MLRSTTTFKKLLSCVKMKLIVAIVIRVTLLNTNLLTWATFSEFLRDEDIYSYFGSRSGEGEFMDDFSKYSFDKLQLKRKTTEGTTPTYSEYETEELFKLNEKEKPDALYVKNFTLEVLKNLPPSSETEFVGGWDEYPLFATPTPTPSLRDKLRQMDAKLSKMLSNPKRYPCALHITYLQVFSFYLEDVYNGLENYESSYIDLAANICRGHGPFFFQQPLNNDTLMNLGWGDNGLDEFYRNYENIKTLLRKIKKEYRMQKYDVATKEGKSVLRG